MSANLPSLSASASPALQLALNGANEATSASAETSGGSGGNPFAALFQQLLGKQAGDLAISPDLLTLPTEAPNTDRGGEAVADLAAMLPFLEAMGLAQAVSAPVEQQTAAPIQQEIVPQAVAAAITPQVASQPAISAVKPGTSPDNRLIAEESIVPLTVEKPATAAVETVMPEHHQAGEATAGHEFSSQLATALAANNDLPHHPGNAQHMMANAQSQQGLATGTASLPVAQAVGTAAWNDEVGNQVVWMANRMESRAELVLNPPQMGRVEISLSVTGEHATANFVSANPVVREALEAALPRLREILADAGIQLGQTQVGAENARQFAQQQEKNGNNFGNVPSSSATTLDTPSLSIAPVPAAGLKFGRGLVDVFA